MTLNVARKPESPPSGRDSAAADAAAQAALATAAAAAATAQPNGSQALGRVAFVRKPAQVLAARGIHALHAIATSARCQGRSRTR
mgnify:CR=1 FL=1